MANTFDVFSSINKARAMRWHRGGLDEWSVTDWSNAFAGEAGELCNAVKKFRRVEDQIQGHDGDTPQPQSQAVAVKVIAKEIGDVYAYLDLVAQRFGLRTFDCIRDTFNQISDREGMPERCEEYAGVTNNFGELREAIEAIAGDRDFVVHSNRVTETVMDKLLALTGGPR